MARLLIVASELKGRALAAAELGVRLRADGHEVVCAAPDAARPVFDAAGLETRALPGHRLDPFSSGLPPPGLRGRLPAGRKARLEQALAGLGAGALGDIEDAARADLLLIDFELHAHILTALGRGWPAALYSSMFPGLPGLRSPPLDSGVVPGEGLAGSRAAVAASWLRLHARKRLRGLRRRLAEAGADTESALRAHAAREGVPLPRATTRRRFQHPWAYRGLPLLVMQAEGLDFPARKPEGLRYLGPMISPRRLEAETRALAGAPWAARLRARKGPLVYASFGTLVPCPANVEAGLREATRRRPDLTVALSAGGRDAAKQDACDGLVRIDWAPQAALLDAAELCVSHGGANTIAECIALDAAMLLYPSDAIDHRANAARVLRNRAGAVGVAGEPPGAVAARVLAALDDPAAAMRRRALRDEFARCVRDRIAEREVARLVGLARR